jgi:hypothetical protein
VVELCLTLRSGVKCPLERDFFNFPPVRVPRRANPVAQFPTASVVLFRPRIILYVRPTLEKSRFDANLAMPPRDAIIKTQPSCAGHVIDVTIHVSSRCTNVRIQTYDIITRLVHRTRPKGDEFNSNNNNIVIEKPGYVFSFIFFFCILFDVCRSYVYYLYGHQYREIYCHNFLIRTAIYRSRGCKIIVKICASGPVSHANDKPTAVYVQSVRARYKLLTLF